MRFDRIVRKKLEAGSRKLRKDLLTECVSKHNRQAVGKAKLSNDEVHAIYMFDQASDQARRLLKLLWGTEQPSYTALPLSTLAMPFWVPKGSLSNRLQADKNAVWHAIASHSWEKVEEMLVRLKSKWDHKCQECIAKGGKPPVRQSQLVATWRDSGREAEVMMMASLWVTVAPDVKQRLGNEEYQKLKTQWRIGNLDTRLLPEVQALRPDFKPADLSFHGSEECVGRLPTDFDADEDAQEAMRQLVLLNRTLAVEQGHMRAFRAAQARQQSASLAAECEWQQAITDAVEKAWVGHNFMYQTQTAKSFQQAVQSGHVAHESLAARLLKDRSDIPCLAVVNVPMLGAAASSMIKDVVNGMATDLQAFPATTMYVVIPPNQVQFGVGRLPKPERDAKVLEHQLLWKAALEDTNMIFLLKASGVWLCLSRSVADNMSSKNIFGSSIIVKRKAIPSLATAMGRTDMENFLKRHNFATSGDTNRDIDIERRQWFSGQAFLSELVGACLKGTKIKGAHYLLVKDFTLYDAELCKFAIAQNSKSAGQQPCRLAYFGVAGAGSTTNKDTIVQNVQAIVEDKVKEAIRKHEYPLAAIPSSFQAKRQEVAAPCLDTALFKLTMPILQGGELVCLESTLEQGLRCGKVCLPETEENKGMNWNQILSQHNQELEQASRPAVTLTMSPNIDEKGMGRCKLPSTSAYEILVAKDGKGYVKGLADDTIAKPLFPIAGFFKTGAEAQHLIASGHSSVIAYCLSATTEVLLRAKGTGQLPPSLEPFSNVPTPLQDILKAMASAGIAIPDIHLHKVTSAVQNGQPEWTVSNTQSSCLKATVEEPGEDTAKQFPPSEVQATKVSSYLDLSGLQASKVVFALEYDGSKLKGMHPYVCLQQVSKIGKGIISQL
eukprot:s1605_g9.t1